MRIAIRQLAATCLVLFVSAVACQAGVFNGIVESVSDEPRSITVKVVKKDRSETFEVKASAVITVDGKKVTLDELQAGQTASITTNGVDEVTKLVVRTAVAKPADDTPPKAATTKGSKPKASGTGKTGSKQKGDDAVDENPIAVGEWPQYRGPNRDNISREPGLLQKWPDDGPQLAWKATGIGLGYSSVAVANGKVYTMGNREDDEFLIALDAKTGDELWALKTGKAYHDGTGDGPRGTPTVDEDRVYALGANGDLVCADADKGEQVWHLNILEEFGGGNITWGISESVLIDGDKLICTPGGKKATLAALNKLNGKTLWKSQVQGSPPAAYASAIAIEVNGLRQYVNFVHTGVVGVKASDGKPLWGEQKSANGTANCSSPLFYDDGVFSASGYGTGGALVNLAGNSSNTKSTFAYHTANMKNHHGGMAVVNGYIYGFDEGVMTCLEWKTGKEKWQDRSVGKGSMTIADGMLYLRSEQGPLALAEVTPDGYNETGRFTQPDRSDKPAWAHPAVAGGKLYLRDMDTLLVYDVKADE